jgi:hypothetical protein
MTGGQSQLPVEQIPAPSLLYDEQLEYVSWKKKLSCLTKLSSLGKFRQVRERFNRFSQDWLPVRSG